jgi:hypothetical protein
MAALLIFLFMRPGRGGSSSGGNGLARVALVQKDSVFRIIPRDSGGASGTVWYAPSDSVLRFQLRAEGLKPGLRYLVELQVDSAIYAITSHAADSSGALALDTALASFANGACVGTNYSPPRPVSGLHRVKFWVKRDGNPPSGTSPGLASDAPGAALPCHGNGDGNYQYLLLENEVAVFTGKAATSR